MRPSALEGKKVIEAGARIIGTVSGLEIEISDWKVTHLRIELTNESGEVLGYKKPFLGHVEIMVPKEVVTAVSDVVTLNKKMEELADVIGPPKRARSQQ